MFGYKLLIAYRLFFSITCFACLPTLLPGEDTCMSQHTQTPRPSGFVQYFIQVTQNTDMAVIRLWCSLGFESLILSSVFNDVI